MLPLYSTLDISVRYYNFRATLLNFAVVRKSRSRQVGKREIETSGRTPIIGRLKSPLYKRAIFVFLLAY